MIIIMYQVIFSQYDIGAQGIAYFDYDIADYRNTGPDFKPWNLGWSYRNDGVDIETLLTNLFLIIILAIQKMENS